jgi:hypothetical protein
LAAQGEIWAEGGQCPDSMLTARVAETLPKEFDGWVMKNIMNANERPSVPDVFMSLIDEALVKLPARAASEAESTIVLREKKLSH